MHLSDGWTKEAIEAAAFPKNFFDQKNVIEPKKHRIKLPPDIGQQIADLKAKDLTHKQIGAKLGIAESTSTNLYYQWNKEHKEAYAAMQGEVSIPDMASPPNTAYIEIPQPLPPVRNATEIDAKIIELHGRNSFPSQTAEALNRSFPGEGWNTKKVVNRIKTLKAKGLIG